MPAAPRRSSATSTTTGTVDTATGRRVDRSRARERPPRAPDHLRQGVAAGGPRCGLPRPRPPDHAAAPPGAHRRDRLSRPRGRTTSSTFQELAERIHGYVRGMILQWKSTYGGVEDTTVAVMGCVVNGPRESKAANIGISLCSEPARSRPARSTSTGGTRPSCAARTTSSPSRSAASSMTTSRRSTRGSRPRPGNGIGPRGHPADATSRRCGHLRLADVR